MSKMGKELKCEYKWKKNKTAKNNNFEIMAALQSSETEVSGTTKNPKEG